MLNKARGPVLRSLAGKLTCNDALMPLTFLLVPFKLTLVIQFHCNKFNPWPELLQSPADLTG